MHLCTECRKLVLVPPTRIGNHWICTPCIFDADKRRARRALKLALALGVVFVVWMVIR